AKTFLGLVRVAIVVAVAFLLLRPVWVKESKGDRRRGVAVLVDVSQSMDRDDPRPGSADRWRVAIAYDLVPPDKGLPLDLSTTPLEADGRLPDRPKRIEVARAALTHPKLDLFAKLRAGTGPVEVSTFGSRRTGRETADTTWLKTLTATEPATALADALNELIGRDENDLPAAIVVVTDGRENASRVSLDDVARECARLKVPLHVYGVGSSAFGQLQLRDVAVSDTVFVDDAVSVPVRYRVKGVTDGRAEIVVTYGGREVAKKTIDPVQTGDDLREVLHFVPTKQDAAAPKQELTVTVRVVGAAGVEVPPDETTKPVRVVDRKLNVLVVDSLPRFDFKFLQRALLRDRRVEASFYLTDADRTTLKSGRPWVPEFSKGREAFRKELFAYDLVILGDVPGSFFNAEQQDVIKEFVSEGGGMIQIAGRWNAPAGWAKGAIADLLPVEFEPVRFPIESPQRPTGFRPVVTPAAARSPLLSLEDDPLDNAKLWRTLPEIFWHYPVTRLRPACEVFLQHPTARTADDKPMPLLAGHYFGKGYVLFLAFDETWRWRFNEAERFFGRFWSQAVYAAGVPRTVGTKLTQLSIDTTEPVRGKAGQVYARLFTKDFAPVTADEVEGRLVKVGADPNDAGADVAVTLTAVRGPSGRATGEYVATLPFNAEGRFALKVDPGNGAPASLEYRVGLPPDDERAPGAMAEGEMRKLAEQSGGRFYREEDLAGLAEAVKPQYVPFTTRTEYILWNRWVMILLVGLLTLEWVVRKFNGLS
ncbi:MAG TPA: hypothetical protein VH092_37825, partial [Urbifossiella sp.]|nr:hypothetical protein [Urbifossiella sp.]